MTFAAVWALAGLVLLVPLVVLHLRQRANHTRDVASLLLWHEFDLESSSTTRRSRRPPLPWLLALQAAALILLTVALAGPALNGSTRPPVTAVVLDDSYWMTAPGSLSSAEAGVVRALRSAPAHSTVDIVIASGTPSVPYRGSISGATAALGRVRPSTAAPDLPTALGVAAGLLTGPRDRMIVVHAPEDPLPSLTESPRELTSLVAGPSVADQGIFNPMVRCGIGTPTRCEVTATVSNTGASAVVDRVVADVPGHPGLSLSTHVNAHSSTPIQLIASPGEQVRLTLAGSDALSLDNTAWVSVPGDENVQRPSAVTVVGTPADALSLAQAFAAVPGVKVQVTTPAKYRASFAQSSDLVVLDDWLPRSGLPAAPALMLVNPPSLPGGQIEGTQPDPFLSGTDAASPLLDGVDLSSLTVNANAASVLVPPRWLAPVVWSPSGALIAAGDNGHTRVVVTAFDTGKSNVAQLSGFPVLATNIVRWGLAWAPSSGAAGAPIEVDGLRGARMVTLRHDGTPVDRAATSGATTVVEAPAPGIYTVGERGPGVSRQATIDINLGVPTPTATGPVDIRTAQLHPGRADATSLTPWLLAAALLALALEWAYWSRHRSRVLI